MSNEKLYDALHHLLNMREDRRSTAGHIADALRAYGKYRWVGIYDVDLVRGLISNLAWSGPNAPAYSVFPVTKGITSRAITEKRTINVGDVSGYPCYLTALDNTRSEIVVPVFHYDKKTYGEVVGTIDVESERAHAFCSAIQEMLEECSRHIEDLWTDKPTR